MAERTTVELESQKTGESDSAVILLGFTRIGFSF